ncbi:HupE/UreJ family protein [Rhizobiales bacterium RZME27]|uniref:HupE/UreJ family protein n=2 Tax=Endobacterium cereale TaxID=2663029 RepID=A0A6A8A2R5_9HYPH|nr:HupE/UreJ family protein [Endobacterium cereale]
MLQYLELGFLHILPEGLDHILFVLGIFLLSPHWRPILVQVTAFTLAHSVTLGLSMYGIVSLPSHFVEPLIALSVAYVAIENIVTRNLSPWRPVVVFCFGLLHGLGFAGALQELQLSRADIIPALISFNIGIELAQLVIIAIAYFGFAIWFQRWNIYRPYVAIPASVVIAAIGLFWTAERVLEL